MQHYIKGGCIMDTLKLFRKRYIPNEIVELKDDVILHHDEEIIVTKWESLKPRNDISGGYSVYFLNKGWKVSRILQHDGSVRYWYCDIVETTYDKSSNAYIFNDMLIDVIIYPDNHVEVVDMDEFADALDNNTISLTSATSALRATDSLLGIIYKGGFDTLTQYVNGYI